MTNLATGMNGQQQMEEADDECLVNRIAYAVGVAVLLFGTVLPHSQRWVMLGVALIAFSYMF
jgi:hypothetical protein